MALIVKVDYATAEEYRGRSVSAIADGKKLPVYFKLLVDDFSFVEGIALAKSDSKIVMVDYVGTLSELSGYDTQGVYVGVAFDFGMDITAALSQISEGMTAIIKLPITYVDMEFVHTMSIKYPSIRFCGGDLILIPDCSIGCCPSSLFEAKGVKLKPESIRKVGCGCAFPVVNMADVELVIGECKVKQASKRVLSSLYSVNREEF